MNKRHRTDGSDPLDRTSRFDGASLPAPRTDEIRHVTLESLLERVDEALAAIASLELDEAGLGEAGLGEAEFGHPNRREK